MQWLTNNARPNRMVDQPCAITVDEHRPASGTLLIGLALAAGILSGCGSSQTDKPSAAEYIKILKDRYGITLEDDERVGRIAHFSTLPVWEQDGEAVIPYYVLIDLHGAEVVAFDFNGLPLKDETLNRCMQYPWATTYWIARTEVTDEGVIALSRHSNLKDLDIEGTRITDAALTHLRETRSLRYLNLRDTTVTNEGLMQLHALKKLTHLNVDGTDVTERGIRRFRRAVPDCSVFFDNKWAE